MKLNKIKQTKKETYIASFKILMSCPVVISYMSWIRYWKGKKGKKNREVDGKTKEGRSMGRRNRNLLNIHVERFRNNPGDIFGVEVSVGELLTNRT